MTLIEKLKELYKHWCEREDNSPMGGIGALDARGRNRGIKDCIDIVKGHSDWVSVSERLPDNNVFVLAYCAKRQRVGYATLHHQEAWTFYEFTNNSESNKFSMANEITHFMELPQTPSEVQSV